MCYKDGINCLESGVGIRCTGHKVVNDDSEMDEIGPEGDFANKIEKWSKPYRFCIYTTINWQNFTLCCNMCKCSTRTSFITICISYFTFFRTYILFCHVYRLFYGFGLTHTALMWNILCSVVFGCVFLKTLCVAMCALVFFCMQLCAFVFRF